ncbi:tryptophan synthase alpha chain [Allocatelliglobosispora scoriae]|uniref:Tryptophan synthase alpha chain n=1 Tax=Allocatelliglobosispora scoriae TaxID=643052 RepID=A0A841BR87_9ACTN|nr:tryptophan synthase subunit alpha [Allocatelliglobosispora scoriae]MBB5869321.1 tryptophan synthase alpha chain [Allocatelliglobosispora scoriae]
MNVAVAYEKAAADGRAALVGYLPAGFPTVAGAVDAINAMIDSGVDIVEIGMPYSDPVMDGLVIQRACQVALEAGVRTRDIISTVDQVTGQGVPILVMTYWNPVERYGVDAFARDLAGAGGAGLITPDLIPDEADEWLAASDVHGLDRIFLVSPSSTDERLAMTVRHCRGFVYATAVMGVTGARDATSSLAQPLVARAKAVPGAPPVSVGLGVRNGKQAAEVGAFADGVIVGSALVSALLDASTPEEGLAGIRSLTTELRAGVAAAIR